MPESPDTSSPGSVTIVASSPSTTPGNHDCGRPAPAVMTSSSSSTLPSTHKTPSSSAAASTSSASSVQPPGVASLNGGGGTSALSSSPPHSRHGDSPSPPSSLGGATGGNSNGCPSSAVNGGGAPGGSGMSNGTGGGRTSRESAGIAGSGAPGSARQLSKVKRFLSTLQHFGSDISVEAGERVRSLILNLMNGTLSIDDFHHKLQETTNFPLRPFVIPFLKLNLPMLQREIVHCARLTKQSPQQYLHQHEHLILDVAHSPHDPPDLFSSSHPASDLNENGKRRNPDRHENGGIDTSLELGPPLKRHHSLMSPPLGHPSSSMGMHGSGIHMRMDDYGQRDYRDRERALNLDREFRHYGFTTPRDFLDDRETEEEWKNIHTMLNCILGMVEKTKRALAILQHRSQTDRQELAVWVRRHAEGAENNLKRHAGDVMAHTLKTTEDRVTEMKRRAEEAVNEVKRQAVVELQKSMAAAEVKTREQVAAERIRMEKLVIEARRQAAEDAAITLNQQADSNEACWNCGRKASETCSGCNAARYCGSFCQHKDWENHHHSCGQNQTASVSSSAGKSGGITSGKPSGHGQSSSMQPTSATGSALISSSSGGPSSAVMAAVRNHSNNPAYSLPSSSASVAPSGNNNAPRVGGVVVQQSANQNSELKSHLESKR